MVPEGVLLFADGPGLGDDGADRTQKSEEEQVLNAIPGRAQEELRSAKGGRFGSPGREREAGKIGKAAEESSRNRPADQT